MFALNRTFRRAVLLLSAIVWLGYGMVGASYAQQSDQQPISLASGTVTSVQGSVIQLSGGGPAIDISKATIYATDNFEDLPITAITVGSRVSLVTFIFQDGQTTVIADQVNVIVPAAGSLLGKIQAIDQTNQTITLLGQQVKITNATEFIGKKIITTRNVIGRVKVGEMVEIDTRQIGSDIIATHIQKAFVGSVIFVPNQADR